MTSSKSFRASIFPMSLSLSSFRSKSQSRSEPERGNSQSQYPKTPRPKPSLKLLRHQTEPSTAATAKNEQPKPVPQPGQAIDGAPVPPTIHDRRANTWDHGTSVDIPTLTPHTIDSQSEQVQRKPIATMPPPTEAPPPPPYKLLDFDGQFGDRIGKFTFEDEEELHKSEPEVKQCPTYSPPVPPISVDTPEISISSSSRQHPHPQIMAIPPSPELPRASLVHEEPATNEWPLERSLLEDTEAYIEQQSAPQEAAHAGGRPRSSSLQQQQQQRKDSLPLPGMKSRQTIPVPEGRGRSVSAKIPTSMTDSTSDTRVTSTPISSRPVSSSRGSQSPTRVKLRKSWMPSGRSRSNSIEVSGNTTSMQAWVISEANQAEYNPLFLKNGEKVPELWNENEAVLVYLYPKSSGSGPSFKVPESTVSSSFIFNELIQSELGTQNGARSRTRSFGGRASLSVEDATRLTPPTVSTPSEDWGDFMRLYLPAAPPSGSGMLTTPGEGSGDELERLIAIRNLFAFLTGQPLVGTKSHPTVFRAFLQIADLLQEFGFTCLDGASFGNAVDLSFGFYCDQLGLADCRHSREQTVEALILGERMRSTYLYNEAFAHAAGKYSAIIDLRLPLFEQVSLNTRQRLERAHLDLISRQHNVNEQLEQFDFPSLFAGIASSTSIPELRPVRFKIWRNSFNRMRQFVLGYYKATFGSWPPKASNKKNPFAESGLNRLVLKVLFSDMCALYDLLVDRKSLTSRVMDEVPAISDLPDKMTMSALRNILSEFDRSKPPVLPPIPFDLPQLPTMAAVLETYNSLSAKNQMKFDKKIKEHELTLVLNKAYNYDTQGVMLPFLGQFKDFEMREAKGKTAHDLVDQRIGYWLFLYPVLQSLPMLVVDAPGLKFTEGTEYFLCEPPMGNLPWLEDGQVRKLWYEVTGGGGYVQLSADAVMFSVEATYRRSHCWLAAKKWEDVNESQAPPPLEQPGLPPLQPPPSVFQADDGFMANPPPNRNLGTPSPPPGQQPQMALRPRNLSPGGSRGVSRAYRSSIVMGLEPVPLEPPNAFGSHHRSSSLGPRPPSSYMGNRSVSTGNLASMDAREPAAASPLLAGNSGATFDDILGDSQKKSSKKKGRFF